MQMEFPNQNGEMLSGILELPENEPRALAVYAHCFTCTKDSAAAHAIAKTLKREKIAVFRFDFTGLGNSPGDFSATNFSTNVIDLIHACKHLAKMDQAPEILIGHSLGGAAVVHAASLVDSVKAVVTIAAPSNTRHLVHAFASHIDEIVENGEADVSIAGRSFTIRKQFLDDIGSVNTLQCVTSLGKPLLVMHAPFDDTVSIENAAAIFQAAKHPKSFVTLDNADHLLSKRADGEYAARVISAWADRYLEEKKALSKVFSA